MNYVPGECYYITVGLTHSKLSVCVKCLCWNPVNEAPKLILAEQWFDAVSFIEFRMTYAQKHQVLDAVH